MGNLTKANRELFRRTPDECFDSLPDLVRYVQQQRQHSTDRWHLPQLLVPQPGESRFSVQIGTDGAFLMNDWSFTQFCHLAGVNKDTVNRLSPETAVQVFRETLPTGNKPLQLLTSEQTVRSIHGVSYTRLWNGDLLAVLQDFATDFQPPQTATGGTGLYAGEQDMFCFLIDPTGWTEIGGQAFAPGFFVWNSEVGRRSVGISTFWFQAVCANHIVWDAVEITEFARKHTAGVHEALTGIRRTLEQLVEKRDQRRQGFFLLMQKALSTTLSSDAEEVQKLLSRAGIQRALGKQALELAREQGTFTVFAVVDALTRLAGQIRNAGERLEVDQKAASLFDLALA